nr:MerR family transcriptional regulator [uncultured Gemmiger sp.]
MPRCFRIGELARLYGVSPDLLRYYEQQGLLCPHRAENGYRVYNIEDIWRLNVIRDLRTLDMPVETIRAYLSDHSAATTRQLLTDELDLLDKRIARLEGLRRTVRQRMDNCERAYSLPLNTCFEQKFPTRRCHALHRPYHTDAEMDPLIQEMRRFDPDHLYVWGNDGIGSFLDLAAARQGDCQRYTGVFILHPKGESTLPRGQYLCLAYRGPNSRNQELVPRLLEEAVHRGYTPQGPLLEFLLADIHISGDDADHVTELQLRVRPTES